MPRYTPKQKQEMVDLYSSGVPGEEVARRFGASLPTVMTAIRAAGKARNYGPSSGRPSGSPVTWTRIFYKGTGWRWVGKYEGQTIALSEARILMAKALGRDLTDKEFVHFVDRDQRNTDEDNLYVTNNPKPKWLLSTRPCRVCGEEKEYPASFPGGNATCASCRSDQTYFLKKLKEHGLTEEQIEAMGTTCHICGQECSSGRRLAIDHDHETGAVRGLLCRDHNVALGLFGDDPELLLAAARYLQERAA